MSGCRLISAALWDKLLNVLPLSVQLFAHMELTLLLGLICRRTVCSFFYFFEGPEVSQFTRAVVIWAAAVKVNLRWNDCEKLLLARWEIVGCIQRNLSLPICSQ